jgi:hypothetical protein
MPINEIVVIDNNGVNSLNLGVSIEDLLKIRVSSGTFKIAGQSYELLSDGLEEIDIDPTYEVDVKGYLAEHNTTKEIVVLYDECTLDGIDVSYDFSDGTYKMLVPIFQLRVPPGTTNLSTLVLNVTKIQPGEVE